MSDGSTSGLDHHTKLSHIESRLHPPQMQELVWGLFARLLGLVYLVAFISLSREIVAIAGRHGISPLAPQLDAMRRDFPGFRRFLRWPTLFWLSASDRSLRIATWLGIGLSLCVIAGLGTPVAFVALFFLYLSFALPLDFFYPWDAALLESGALAVFLPSLTLLPEIGAVDAPLPAISWGYSWLLFRIVFGFGKYKFFGPGKLHFDYLSSFLISQPLSTPFALWAKRRLPKVAFTLALALLFVVEVPTPFLIFGPEPARLFAMASFVALMLAIQLSGNFGFFNLIVGVLSIPLLSALPAPWEASAAELVWPLNHLLATALALGLFVGGLLSLPFNSWIAQAWPYWTSFERIPVLRGIVAFLRILAPFRLLHAFGVFSPESGPPLKWVPVVEGTRDGENWVAYRYRFMPSAEDSPARFVAPFMPRFDHALIYDALGISLSSLVGSVFAVQNPYRFGRFGWMDRLAQRLLEGRKAVQDLFLEDPFEGERPMAIRIRLKTFELAEEGGPHTWVVRDVGTHLPETRLDPRVFEALPPPELFHWDDRATRRLSRPWLARIAADETSGALDSLFVGLAAEDFSERLAALSAAERRELELLVERIAWRLAQAFESTKPAEQWFDLVLMAHDALLRGRKFVVAAFDSPSAALEALRPVNVERGLRLVGAFRPEMVAFTARKARVRELTLRGAARKAHPLAPAILKHLPAIAGLFPDPTQELIGYERAEGRWQQVGQEVRRPPPPTVSFRPLHPRRMGVHCRRLSDSASKRCATQDPEHG